MRVLARTQYALRAVMYLATAAEPTSTARDIADNRGIPHRFLEEIIADLRRAGLVRSRRGARGGYQLTVAPDELSIASVVNAVQPAGMADRGEDGVEVEPALAQLWTALDAEIDDFLDGVSIADLVAGQLPGWAAQLANRGSLRTTLPARDGSGASPDLYERNGPIR